MKNKIYCTVDIGGTKILMLLINEKGKILYRRKIATPKPAHPSSVVESVKVMLKEADIDNVFPGNHQLHSIGICIAGFIEADRGIVHQSPNLYWHEPVNLGELITEKLNCPVLVENDANAAVLGEVFFGAAKGHRDVIYVTISTGIGGGLFLNGQLYRGSRGFAGEIGHIKPFGRGRQCNCGGNDCLEIWASGTGIAQSANAVWDKKEWGLDDLDAQWVFDEAEKGNELAQAIIDDAALKTGRALANLVNMLNPSCIVVGGGIAAGRPAYFKEVIEIMKKEAIRPAVQISTVEVVEASLEPDAGVWGMYALLTGQVVS